MVEGAPHTAKRSTDQLLCLWGAPAPYIKEQGWVRTARGEGAPGGVLLLPGVGLPLFLVGIGEKGERGGGEEGRGGAPPPSPYPIRTRGEGRVAQPWPPLLSSTKAH